MDQTLPFTNISESSDSEPFAGTAPASQLQLDSLTSLRFLPSDRETGGRVSSALPSRTARVSRPIACGACSGPYDSEHRSTRRPAKRASCSHGRTRPYSGSGVLGPPGCSRFIDAREDQFHGRSTCTAPPLLSSFARSRLTKRGTISAAMHLMWQSLTSGVRKIRRPARTAPSRPLWTAPSGQGCCR